jgi:ATP-dependent Clp protease ATP-binding subunit ClpA
MSSGSEASKVFRRFTEQAHQVLDLGRDEAERIGHRYLGPEHLLLGMLHDGAGMVDARVTHLWMRAT